MRFEKFVALRGPNVWSRRPVVEAWVELETFAAWRLSDAPGLVERLVGWLPKLRQMPLGCEGAESIGLLPQKLSASSTLAHVLTETTLELQLLAGPGERFGETHAEPTPGCYRVVVACQEVSVSAGLPRSGPRDRVGGR